MLHKTAIIQKGNTMKLSASIQVRAKRILLTGMSLISGAVYQSCGGDLGEYDLGYTDYGYYDTGYYGGYGPIDQDVFDNAAADWSDYIRG